jgi:hypothetical protein
MIPKIDNVKVVSKRKLISVWKKVTDGPLPDVTAYILKDEEFLKAVNLINKNKGVRDTRIKEYGVDFDNKIIEACTFEFEGHLIIFIKESGSLQEALEHELRHVSNWKHLDKH